MHFSFLFFNFLIVLEKLCVQIPLSWKTIHRTINYISSRTVFSASFDSAVFGDRRLASDGVSWACSRAEDGISGILCVFKKKDRGTNFPYDHTLMLRHNSQEPTELLSSRARKILPLVGWNAVGVTVTLHYVEFFYFRFLFYFK